MPYLALPILYMPVPQTGHAPFVAGLPFFIVTGVASFISRWVRHFRRYASKAILLELSALYVRCTTIAYSDEQFFELESGRSHNRPLPRLVKQIRAESALNLARFSRKGVNSPRSPFGDHFLGVPRSAAKTSKHAQKIAAVRVCAAQTGA